MINFPVIFNGDMVRAILAGRKTQTRRPVRFAGKFPQQMIKNGVVLEHAYGDGHKGLGLYSQAAENPEATPFYTSSPFGRPGDRLYVREKWGVITHVENTHGEREKWVPNRPAKPVKEMPYGKGYFSGHIIYAADGNFRVDDEGEDDEVRFRWHPGLLMPRAASRLSLDVTGIRVEHLQDITEEGAVAEGVERVVIGEGWRRYYHDPEQEAAGLHPTWSARDSFRSLWASLYGDEFGDEGWKSNPLVWVVDFKVREQEPEILR